MLSLIKADLAGFLTLVGSFFIILGAFLPWMTGSSQLGVAMAQGAVLLLIGVLFLIVLALSRSGAAGAWSTAMFLLCALALALIFQSIKYIADLPYVSIGAGVWLTMVGVLGVTAAVLLPLFGAKK